MPGSSMHHFMHGTRGLLLELADKLGEFFDIQLTKPKRPKAETR